MINLTIYRISGEVVEMEFPSYQRLWKVYKRLRGVCKMHVW